MQNNCRYITILILSTLLFSPVAAARDDVMGRWANDTSILEISAQGDNLSARVFAMLEPQYREDEISGPPGTPRRDNNNPDDSLNQRPLQNLELLSNYQFNGKRWEGKIYDPESGNTYSSRMEVDADGNLKMRGYIGISLIGRTAILTPLGNCTGTMRQMLRNSGRQAEECQAAE